VILAGLIAVAAIGAGLIAIYMAMDDSEEEL